MASIKCNSIVLVTTMLLVACGDAGGPSSAGRQVAFHLATRPGAAAPVRGAALAEEVLTAGTDVIVVTGVQMVVREIELKRTGVAACDTAQADDDCEELEIGPVLLDLPLGAGATREFTVAIDTGSYEKLEFEVHKPSSSDDAAFVAANPLFDGVSIRMTGTYNGTPFIYTSDLDVEQERTLDPPLVVTETTGANVTMFVDLRRLVPEPDSRRVHRPGHREPGRPVRR